MRTVALYGNSLGLSTIAATLAGRTGLCVLPVEQLGEHQPDIIIFDLAAPGSDFNIALWRARPQVLLIGVDLGSDRMFTLSGRPSQVLTLENLYQAIESLPQGEVMAIKNRKYVWLAVAGVAAAALILTVSLFWPPVARDLIQGAIGHRDVYRQAQLTDQDVGVAGQVKVTVDDIRNLLESPDFKTLAKDPEFQKALADGRVQNFIAAHVNEAHNSNAQQLLAHQASQNANAQNVVAAHQASQNANAQQLAFAHQASQNAFAGLIGNAHSVVALSHVAGSSAVQGLANNGHLMDATFNGAAQNAIINAVAANAVGSQASKQ